MSVTARLIAILEADMYELRAQGGDVTRAAFCYTPASIRLLGAGLSCDRVSRYKWGLGVVTVLIFSCMGFVLPFVYLPVIARLWFSFSSSAQSVPGWLQNVLGALVILSYLVVTGMCFRMSMAAFYWAWLSVPFLDGRPPFLALRTFTRLQMTTSESEYTILDPAPGGGGPTVTGTERESHFLTIADALRAEGRVIFIGDPENRRPISGTTRRLVVVQPAAQEWAQAFRIVARSARAIVLIPDVSTGLQLEIADILSDDDLLKKTVVFMPAGKDESVWQEIQRVFRNKGLKLPNYDSTGGFYVPDRLFDAVSWQSLNGLSTARTCRRALNALIRDRPSTARPLCSVLIEIGATLSGRHISPPPSVGDDFDEP